MIPTRIEDWNLEAIETLLRQGVFESDRFDFKETLPPGKSDGDKLRLKKACAAFANSDGGFLIFGIKDDKGLSVAERMVSLDPAQDFPEQFGNYPRASEPSLSGAWSFKNPPVTLGNGRVVHVVHVPSSPRRPHGVREDHRWWFCKRTNKGTEELSYEELRALFVNAEQLKVSLALFRSELERVRELAEKQGDATNRSLDQYVATRYYPARLEALLPLVFGVLSLNSWLVRYVDGVRNATQEADAWLSAVSPFAELSNGQRIVIREKVARDSTRIYEAAKNALIALDKVTT